MPDRVESLVVSRTNSGTVLKLTIKEDGITVNYSLKTYSSGVVNAEKVARIEAEEILNKLKRNN